MERSFIRRWETAQKTGVLSGCLRIPHWDWPRNLTELASPLLAFPNKLFGSYLRFIIIFGFTAVLLKGEVLYCMLTSLYMVYSVWYEQCRPTCYVLFSLLASKSWQISNIHNKRIFTNVNIVNRHFIFRAPSCVILIYIYRFFFFFFEMLYYSFSSIIVALSRKKTYKRQRIRSF